MHYKHIFSNTCKTLGIVFCFLLATFMGAGLVSFVSAGPAVPGDANFDGVVEAVDVQLVVSASLGTDIGNYDADINNDYVIDAVDVQLVINATLGIDISGPIAQETWQRTFGISGYEYADAVQQTADGGFILAGTIGSFEEISDVYLVKTDSSGKELWSKTYEKNRRDYTRAVQQTDDGGFVIAGRLFYLDKRSDTDMFLMKTDSNGNELWSKTFGGGSREDIGTMQLTTDGGFVLAGDTHSFGAVKSDMYLVKTDSSGNELWGKTYGGSDEDAAFAMQQTADGGFVLVGYTYSYPSGEFPSCYAYLVKTDSDGNELWSNTFGGGIEDHGRAVQQTTDGGFIMAAAGLYYEVDRSGEYLGKKYLVKTDSDGNEIWTKTFGGNGLYSGYSSMQLAADGGFVLAGSTRSSYTARADIRLLKTDSSGNELWSRIFGGSEGDTARSLQQTADGGFVLAGSTDSFGAGLTDMYLVKTDSEGNSPDPPE